jgi:hypothetical protein
MAVASSGGGHTAAAGAAAVARPRMQASVQLGA